MDSSTMAAPEPQLQSMVTAPTPTVKPPRKPRPNYGLVHRHPLPLEVHALPAFLPQNPISVLRLAYVYLSHYLHPPSSHLPPTKSYRGYWDEATSSVHITDPTTIRALWEQGFFGKGSLSRSEPEWEKLRRERQEAAKAEREGRGGNTAAEVTRKRREERRREKLERARVEADALEEQLRAEGKLEGEKEKENQLPSADEQTNGHTVEKQQENQDTPAAQPAITQDVAETVAEALSPPSAPPTSTTGADTTTPPLHAEPNQEHLQLTPSEAFFLTYALGILDIHVSSTSADILSTSSLLTLFRRHSYFPPKPQSSLSQPPALSPSDPFLLTYTAYHHYRALGWVIRPGLKFGCDFLLYYRGPAFSHAEFAVLVVPDYSLCGASGAGQGKSRDWWWLHAANRVQSQVRKTLVLCYVEVPPEAEEVNKQSGDVDIGKLLATYRIREFVLKRWTPNRDRG